MPSGTQMHFSATIFHFLETWHGLNALYGHFDEI